MKRILVTGATGFVGSYICSKLLEDENNFLYVIARKKRMRTAQDRVLDAIAKCNEKVNIMDVKSRIKVFEGDIEEEQLGLSSQEYTCLKEEINVIYHSAASIKFSLDYEDAKKINCGGTQKIVALMKEIHPEQFERLNYISTAYVAGDYRKGFKETDLDVNQVFNNTYEQSK